MKTTIEVANRKEAEALRMGLDDPSVRAFVLVMGVLRSLPSDRARVRVVKYVEDFFDEQEDQTSKP